MHQLSVSLPDWQFLSHLFFFLVSYLQLDLSVRRLMFPSRDIYKRKKTMNVIKWKLQQILYVCRISILEHLKQKSIFTVRFLSSTNHLNSNSQNPIEVNIVHLFPVPETDMKICLPKKIHISPSATPRNVTSH